MTVTRSETASERGLPRRLVVLLGVAATVVAVTGPRGAADVIAPVFLAVLLDADPRREWARTLVSSPPPEAGRRKRRRARPDLAAAEPADDAAPASPAAGPSSRSEKARPTTEDASRGAP